MIITFFRYVSTAYPVLKESILGRQTLLGAFKTNKIKVLTFFYCLLSPFFLYYLTNKAVRMAAENVALTRRLAEVENNKPIIKEPIVAPNQPVDNTANSPAKTKAKPSTAQVKALPSTQASDAYNHILTKDYEND